MSKMNLFIPISKVDVAKRLVYGKITEETPDKSGEMFDYDTGKGAVQKWSDEISAATQGKSKGNVRAMHGSIAAGKFTDITYDDKNKAIHGCAKVVDDAEWNKVLEGVYTGFSIGGGYEDRWPDMNNPNIMRFTPIISEVSLVDNPCVPTATFEVIKQDGSVEIRKFHSIKGDTMTTNKFVENGKLKKPSAEPVSKWLAKDGSQHDKKQDAVLKNLELEAAEKLAPGANAFDAVLAKHGQGSGTEHHGAGGEGASTEVDPAKAAGGEPAETNGPGKAPGHKEGEPDTTIDKSKKTEEMDNKEEDDADKSADDGANIDPADSYEDGGAHPGKDHGATITGDYKTEADMSTTDTSTGKAPAAKGETPREEAAGGYKAADFKDAKKADKIVGLQKGLGHVAELAYILQGLDCLHERVEMEQEMEHDDSSQQEDELKEAIETVASALRTMVAEETNEMLEDDDVVEAVHALEGPGVPLAMSAGVGALSKAITEGADKAKLKKTAKLVDALEKFAVRHSAKDMATLQQVHKHVGDMMDKCNMITKCMKEAGVPEGKSVDDEPDGSADDHGQGSTTKFAKVASERDTLRAENVVLTKLIGEMNSKMEKATPIIEELAKRVEHLEKQPMPGKGHVRAISKSQDGGSSVPVVAQTEETVIATLSKMSAHEKQKLLMKAALRQGTQLAQDDE